MIGHLLMRSVKTYARSESGHQLKHVVCDKCKTEYWYLLSRVGIGTASYVVGSGSRTAARAAENAKKILAKRLDREAELVPCPKCDWISEELVSRIRKQKYPNAPIAMGVLLIVAIVAFLLVSLNAESYRWSPALAWKVSSIPAAIAIAILPIRAMVRGRYNPNHAFPNGPELPVGTPSALVKSNESSLGSQSLEPVDVSYSTGGKFDGWAVLRPGQLVFPNMCCLCLKETMEVYSPRLSVSKEDKVLPVPFCRECRRNFRRIWLMTAFLTVVGAAVIAMVLAISIPRIDDIGRVMIFIFVVLFGSLFGAFSIPNRICQPYRFGMIDKNRGIMKFASKNDDYTQLLVQQTRQLEAAIASRTTA